MANNAALHQSHHDQERLEEEPLATSQSGESSIKHDPTAEATTLTRWGASKMFGLLLDILTILFSCLFFVYGLAVKAYDGAPRGSAMVELLRRASNLAPTVYPILFAAVVGKALKSIAFWRLERGGRVGVVDQLIGSTTIFQTISTQFQMRSPGMVSIALVLAWALSPLGGQASLRIIDQAIQVTTDHAKVQCVNTTSMIMSDTYGGGDAESDYIPVNAMFAAGLVSYATAKHSSQDSWGNVRIPLFEQLNLSFSDGEGWYQVSENLTSDQYASVLGLPVSQIDGSINTTTTFELETSYWVLNCPFLGFYEQLNETLFTSNLTVVPGYAFSAKSNSFTLISNSTRPLKADGTDAFEVPLTFFYMDQNNDNMDLVLARCTIETSYVDISVTCLEGSCRTTRTRRSQTSHLPPTWTALDTSSISSFGWFAKHFMGAFKEGHGGYATPYQNFILNPYDAFNSSMHRPALSILPNATFAIRLGQLFNTYWMAMLTPTAIPKGLDNVNFTADIESVSGTMQQSTDAVIEHSILVLRCDNLWLIVLLISTGVTTLIGVFGLAATIFRRGPEIGLNISSMIKDSPFVDQSAISSTLDASDRTRMCKNLVVKYGDVACEDEAGYVAIGNRGVSTFSSRRLYV